MKCTSVVILYYNFFFEFFLSFFYNNYLNHNHFLFQNKQSLLKLEESDQNEISINHICVLFLIIYTFLIIKISNGIDLSWNNSFQESKDSEKHKNSSHYSLSNFKPILINLINYLHYKLLYFQEKVHNLVLLAELPEQGKKKVANFVAAAECDKGEKPGLCYEELSLLTLASPGLVVGVEDAVAEDIKVLGKFMAFGVVVEVDVEDVVDVGGVAGDEQLHAREPGAEEKEERDESQNSNINRIWAHTTIIKTFTTRATNENLLVVVLSLPFSPLFFSAYLKWLSGLKYLKIFFFTFI
ncbi:hypothetical protein IEQ34_019458 [Dendrobium chrysotoxum]|uniref:Uncharacterized protein n=1 Tax=Dendrobium chrysotoxum TaxID=161865 RepID=A0AAV7FRH6_DENCH|nr:hypothetical protein IEQ34_019458 [Dendrobium chrysotoxum]